MSIHPGNVEDDAFLRRLSEEMSTQDNCATARPLFVLQHEIRQYGIDPAEP